VLSTRSRKLQSPAFQTITGHGFHADYSDRFQPTAGDRTDCPDCGEHYTVSHVVEGCESLWEPRGDTMLFDLTPNLMSSYLGSQRLVKFLHRTQALLRPLTHAAPRPPTGTRPVKSENPSYHSHLIRIRFPPHLPTLLYARVIQAVPLIV
jgi:hypothetical protein